MPRPYSDHRLAQRIRLRAHPLAFLSQYPNGSLQLRALDHQRIQLPVRRLKFQSRLPGAVPHLDRDDLCSSASLASCFCSARILMDQRLLSRLFLLAVQAQQTLTRLRSRSPQRLNPQLPIPNLRPPRFRPTRELLHALTNHSRFIAQRNHRLLLRRIS